MANHAPAVRAPSAGREPVEDRSMESSTFVKAVAANPFGSSGDRYPLNPSRLGTQCLAGDRVSPDPDQPDLSRVAAATDLACLSNDGRHAELEALEASCRYFLALAQADLDEAQRLLVDVRKATAGLLGSDDPVTSHGVGAPEPKPYAGLAELAWTHLRERAGSREYLVAVPRYKGGGDARTIARHARAGAELALHRALYRQEVATAFAAKLLEKARAKVAEADAKESGAAAYLAAVTGEGAA